MNYLTITHNDMLNGDGLRVVLWVSGCTLHCEDCQNKYSWDFNEGVLFDERAKEEIFSELEKDYISGITITGGHPLEKQNIEEIEKLCKEIKINFPNKTIWLYTGFVFEEIKNYPILKYIDVLIDGRYEKELRDISLKWRGSTYQRAIDVQKSLTSSEVVLWCD